MPVHGVASGNWQQYKVSELKTPDEGDTIEYTLVITAEDAFGNKGEKTIALLGKYAGNGQKLGEATIVIDMGIVGLGSSSVTCDVLAGEPASCTVAKAVWGYDAGEPFGAAERSLGWSAECNDPLGVGFYLASLDDGSGLGRSANALSGKVEPDRGRKLRHDRRAVRRRYQSGHSLALHLPQRSEPEKREHRAWRTGLHTGLRLGI